MAYIGPSEETMVRRAYKSVLFGEKTKTINSNQIMVYMGSYITNNLGENNDDYIKNYNLIKVNK